MRIIEEKVEGARSKCAIIIYEMWHPGECHSIAVDIHILTLGKSLGVFRFDCSGQKLVKSNLELILDQCGYGTQGSVTALLWIFIS